MAQIHSEAAQIIGSRIRKARWAQGLTMDDLSELARLSLTSVNKIERGQQSPSAETLVRLATALDIDASALITGISAVDYGEPREHLYTARDFLREKRRRKGRRDGEESSDAGSESTESESTGPDSTKPGSTKPDSTESA